MKKILLLAPLFAILAACGGGGGSDSSTPEPVVTTPTVRLTAAKSVVVQGDDVVLSWSSTGADSCRAVGVWSGELPKSGQVTLKADQTADYAVSCGTAHDGVTVEVLPSSTPIPDAAFEGYLVEAGVDDVIDGQVSTKAALAATTISITSERGITSLSGIENFRNLTKLQLEQQSGLAHVDPTKLTKLTWLNVWRCPITTIDVSQNVLLTQLGLSEVELTTVDVSKLVNVVELALQNSSDDPTSPYGVTKGLTSLDVSKNVKLQRLYVEQNRLTSLDTSANQELREAWFAKNHFTRLDFSKNSKLVNVLVWDNDLEYLNIKGIAGGTGIPQRLYTTGNARLQSVLVTNVQAINSEIARRTAADAQTVGIYLDSWTVFTE